MTLPELFDAIKKTSSSKEKIELLKKFPEQTKLQALLKDVYNYKIIFGITSNNINIPASTGNEADIEPEFFEILRTKRGRNEKIQYIKDVINRKSGNAAKYLLAALDKDLGIGINVKNINKAFPKLIPEFPLMLAQPESKEKFITYFDDVEFVYVNQKIDGIRCVADCNNDTPMFFTRGGHEVQEFLVENIKKEIVDNYDKFKGRVYDGEIYTGNFQELMKVVQRKKITDVAIKLRNTCRYAIFDIINFGQTLHVRIDELNDLQLQGQYIKIVKYAKFKKDYILLKAFADKYIKQGHEGIVVKHPDGEYETKRSYHWMKFKGMDTVDLKVVSCFEGEGKYQGKLGGLTLLLPNNNTVNCGSGFTDEERDKLWTERESLVGKYAEIKYMEETTDASLRHPVFLRIRYDIKEKEE